MGYTIKNIDELTSVDDYMFALVIKKTNIPNGEEDITRET